MIRLTSDIAKGQKKTQLSELLHQDERTQGDFAKLRTNFSRAFNVYVPYKE